MIVSTPLLAAGGPVLRAGQAQQTATISGTARFANGQVAANTRMQLRNVTSGELVANTTTGADGTFRFERVPAPATYTVEIVTNDGRIIGATAALGVAANASVTGVAVTATAATAGAGGAAAGAGAAAAGGASAAGVSTAIVVTSIAAAAGATGLIIAANRGNASPSR